jgi:hypothetical protein
MTPDEKLTQADRDIDEVRQYLARQLRRIGHLEANGQDTKLAWSTLLAVEQALATMRQRRRQLLAALVEDAAGPSPEP